jgi:hypothetical protein
MSGRVVSLHRDAPPVVGVRHGEGHDLIIDHCLFCGGKHVHGDGGDPGPYYGHRVAHCPRDVGCGYFLVDRDADRDVLLLGTKFAPCFYEACHLLYQTARARLYLVFPRQNDDRWRIKSRKLRRLS